MNEYIRKMTELDTIYR